MYSKNFEMEIEGSKKFLGDEKKEKDAKVLELSSTINQEF